MAVNLLTTRQAAARLGVHPSRVRHLILAGRLPAKKHGRDWIIRLKDLEAVRHRRPGRPGWITKQ